MKTFLYPLLLLLPLLLTTMPAEATHLRGGYIHYTLDAENPRKAYFTMALYTATESPGDEPLVMISMGDGITIRVDRHSSTHIRPNVDRNIFKWEYTFPTSGTFTVSWVGENRNGGILNLAAPTDQLLMGIATEIKINPLDPNRNSVQIKTEPYFTAYRGEPLRFNLLAHDPDGDSLGYELIAPLHADAQKLLQPAPGFTVPEGFTINRFGEVHWENPAKVGEYAFAVAISQYRKGIKVGHTIFDMQFLVLNNLYELPEIKLENREELTFLKDGRLLVKPGEKVSLRLHFPYQADKTWLSELQELGLKDASFRSISSFVTEFTFTATEDLSRRQPYGINFNYSYRPYSSPVSTTITFTLPLLIWQPEEVKLEMLASGNLTYTPEGYISSIPGQDIKVKLFAYNGLGNTVDLSIESNLKTGAEHFSFVTRDSADSVVGELVFTPSEKQISSTPYTVTMRSSSMQLRTSDSPPAIKKEVTFHVLVSAASPLSSGEDLASDNVKVYPNPAKRSITVNAQRPTDTFSLYAADGRLVYQAKVVSGENHIRLPPGLKPGLYTYTVGANEQLSGRGKLLLL